MASVFQSRLIFISYHFDNLFPSSYIPHPEMLYSKIVVWFRCSDEVIIANVGRIC